MVFSLTRQVPAVTSNSLSEGSARQAGKKSTYLERERGQERANNKDHRVLVFGIRKVSHALLLVRTPQLIISVLHYSTAMLT